MNFSMRFGPYSELVEEVLVLARSGSILSGKVSGPKLDSFLIEDDFDVATDIALTQDPVAGCEIWHDLRSVVMSDVRSKRHALAGFADAAAHLSALGDELNLIVRMHLSSGPFLAISDEVAADLS